MTKYKEIQVGGNGVTVEFDADPIVEIEKPIEDIQLEDIAKVPKEDTIPEKKEEVEQKKTSTKTEKGSRAQKRIRQLHSEKQEMVQQLEIERQEKLELQRLLKEGHTDSKTSMKDTLENQIKILTSSLKEAMESGNSDTVITLQDDLINSKMELAMVANELKTAESVKAETSPTPARPQVEMPEQALDWMDEHPTFKTDELFRVSTITVNNQLIREGYDIHTDEFYTELNKRLSKRFPEEFGVKEKNSVESKEDTKLSSDDQGDVKEKSSSKTRSVEQTVSGSSRPSAVSVNSPVKKNSVTLSPQDVEQAERWGLSLEQMARRMAHSANNKRIDGYVPIQIKG